MGTTFNKIEWKTDILKPGQYMIKTIGIHHLFISRHKNLRADNCYYHAMINCDGMVALYSGMHATLKDAKRKLAKELSKQ